MEDLSERSKSQTYPRDEEKELTVIFTRTGDPNKNGTVYWDIVRRTSVGPFLSHPVSLLSLGPDPKFLECQTSLLSVVSERGLDPLQGGVLRRNRRNKTRVVDRTT